MEIFRTKSPEKAKLVLQETRNKPEHLASLSISKGKCFEITILNNRSEISRFLRNKNNLSLTAKGLKSIPPYKDNDSKTKRKLIYV